MDADVSLPIYHTPWIPVINPEQPIAQAVKRRRRLLADIKSKKVLPNANALLRGKKEQDSDSIVSLHDFWEYNLASSSWLRLPPNEGRNNPMRRSLHGAVSIGTKMLIFGRFSFISIIYCGYDYDIDNSILRNFLPFFNRWCWYR
jgi:hypothetical protein